jgi:hypothetical protein
MILAELIEVATSKIINAEVRLFKKDESMTVLVKDYKTSTLNSILLNWDGEVFKSPDNKYQSSFTWDESLEKTKLTKIYKI